MKFKTLDTVALNTDIASEGLCRGDLGAVVQIYEPEALEVEFVTAAGRTRALVTLNVRDVRAVDDADLVAVRRSASVAAPRGQPTSIVAASRGANA